MKPRFSLLRQNMIDCQIKTFGVINDQIIDAFSNIAREIFVPQGKRSFAYVDADIDVEQGRIMMNPSVHARLLQELDVKSGDNVLDLCSGPGYSTAILSQCGCFVTSVDHKVWMNMAKENHQKISTENITWHETEDIYSGCEKYAPYDAIIINGAVHEAPDHLLPQLKDGGKIACIFSQSGGQSSAVLFIKTNNSLVCYELFDAFTALLPEFETPKEFEFN